MPGLASALGALAVATAFGLGAWRLRALSPSGAVAAGVLAWALLALGGPAWAVPGLTFFVLSSLLSKLGRHRKQDAEALAEKGDRRDAGQVLANGGVAGLLLALHAALPLAAPGLVPDAALYAGFVGAFAAAAADTWGTEIGTLVGGPTWSVTTGRRVAPGTSGGVSAAGSLGMLLGAAVVTLSALPVGGADVGGAGWGFVGAGGVAGALLDSLLGATVQARYRRADGALTERRTEGGRPLPLARGWAGVDNDRVNGACTLLGALLPLLALL